MEIFTVRNLSFTYPEQRESVLEDLSFTVEPGEFIALVGPSGCGKTTLLRQLKTVLTPHGKRAGTIQFEGAPLCDTDERIQASRIGFVQQSPENQLVTDKVWHELAFGLESLGYDTPAIRNRVAEMASFFGMQTWFYKNVSELSGGQKQLLNLASIMVMQPSVLILDEPTSQLDPIAASDFLAALGKINRELGVTVILTEHRLEEVFPLSTRVLVMDGGRLICDASPNETGQYLKQSGHPMFLSVPTPMRVWAAAGIDLPCPVTVRDGRAWLDSFAQRYALHSGVRGYRGPVHTEMPAIEMADVWFRYEKNGPDVIKGLSIKAYPGEFLCLLGGNGTGKTTALSLITGSIKPFYGSVNANGGLVAAMPQNPQTLFVKKTVRDDLLEVLKEDKLPDEEKEQRAISAARLCRIDKLLMRHPYDLSGGEQQQAALAKVLLLRPKTLLMDEPTKGLDAEFKQTFAAIIRSLAKNGVCVVMASHDIEFCAEYADRCALLFDGNIVTQNAPREFFSGNSFYTTAANRMARHLLPDALTAEDVITACGGAAAPPLEEIDLSSDKEYFTIENVVLPEPQKEEKLPLWRKILAIISGASAVGAFVYVLKHINLTEILTTGSRMQSVQDYKTVYIVLIVSLFLLALSVTLNADKQISEAQVQKAERKLHGRTIAAMCMILVAVPLTIFLGTWLLGDRKYYFISLLVILEAMLPFVMVFENRKPQARELVIIAALCAIGVAGRAAFIALPGFKPVTAVVIIAGVAFGGETGFLVGALTMFASNMLFGQGPWTPWQMFSMGIVGFLAGVLFRKGFLRRSRLSLCIFGALMAVIVYGGLMNPASVIMYQSRPALAMFVAAYAAGFPVDLVHAAATVLFLWFISQPLLEKLDRIKTKYGLMK